MFTTTPASLLFGALLAASTSITVAAPAPAPDASAQKLADPNYGPIPGQSSLYSTYDGVAPPFPGNVTAPILPTATGPPGADDVIWQNLLSAEWVIFSFYQAGVEAFNASDFVSAGFPTSTYTTIAGIRDNEAGHLRIFQNEISATSVKPGACKYQYPFDSPAGFLALATFIEISSMAFLTGLVQEPQSKAARGAMLAIAQVETRHEVWALLNIWGSDALAGPADTVFPYANQILDETKVFIVPGSCPPENPVYPTPDQNLPTFTTASGTKSLAPGSTITLNFTSPANQPEFEKGKGYFAVFSHAVSNISVPIDTSRWPKEPISVTIPHEFEAKGIIIAVLADTPGAPRLETVVAGPAILLQEPAAIGLDTL